MNEYIDFLELTSIINNGGYSTSAHEHMLITVVSL